MRRRGSTFRATMRGLVLAWLCAATPSHATAEQRLAPAEGTPADYLIATGDELDIMMPLNPEFSVRTFVRPDGKISLELIDEIQAEGLTAAQLTQQLENAYATELRDPEISVNVVSMAARIYVDGHVEKPGEYGWSRQVTAMQAVALAGGLRETANGDRLIVVRRVAGGDQQIFEIDLEKLSEGAAGDMFLSPYDTVYAPSSRVAEVNKWIDQYIRKNIPVTPREILTTDTGGGGGGGVEGPGQVGN